MEILYTEITQDLTEGLLEISLEELEKNRKVSQQLQCTS